MKLIIHEVRYAEVLENDCNELSYEQFLNSLKVLGSRYGSKYDFIIKSGPSFTAALFKLYQVVWDTEVIPDLWKRTTLVQAYKGKGSCSDLDKLRHLHIKEDIPKILDTLLCLYIPLDSPQILR